MSHLVCYVTCGSPDEARRIGRTVVSERLAACANILDGMRSIYWWKGEIEEAEETVLILKTRGDLFEALRERVVALHGYETACVVALPVTSGNAPYLAWIEAETREGTT